MRLFLIFLFISLILAQNISAQESKKSSSEPQLIKMVILSRHGVRAPTQSETTLSYWSQKPWPKWPVKKGELTERGAGLVTEMWKNMRDRFNELGLLPGEACPNPDLIYVRADVDERTKATARAILNGLAANCSLGFAFLENEKVDPLFHPVKAGYYRFNGLEAATDILSMAKGGLGKVQEELERSIDLIGQILGPPATSLCLRFTMGTDCELTDLPNAISISPNGDDIKLMGSLDIASSSAEIFLLEYSQWAGESAGWGQVNNQVLQQIMPAHSRVFDIVNRAPIVALAKGSPLLREMAAALGNSHYDPRCNNAKLVVFVGHDTNIANLGSLLKINWKPSGFPDNGIPPASSLALELWEHNKNFYVVARFFSQTPETLHTPLPGADSKTSSLDFKPVEEIVTLENSRKEMRYTMDEFFELVKEATAGSEHVPQENPPFYYGNVTPVLNK